MTPLYATEILDRGYKIQMEHKGFKATLMRATRLKDNGRPHALPPGFPVPVYPVDALPGCPGDWMRGGGNYVCPVNPDEGLWFDWTDNDPLNTAVLPSVKGMNPITGQKLEGLALEQYKENCPIHKTKFSEGRLCEKCGYKWPAQSYACAPNRLWWDGFRQPDGTVRQFFFTEDEKRDIASIVIGKQNTVPAFGFAFYEPVVRRVPTPPLVISHHWHGSPLFGSVNKHSLAPEKYSMKHEYNEQNSMYYNSSEQLMNNYCAPDVLTSQNMVTTCSVEPPSTGDNLLRACRGVNLAGSSLDKSRSKLTSKATKSVSIGAGAIISQELADDTLAVTDWKPEAASVIRLYFVFKEQFKKIAKAGVKDLDGSKEGFMKGLPVG
jgi:hypothetical protein